MNKADFIFPRHRYQGEFKAKNLIFNANLQEFSQKVGYIANLETGGKISPAEACKQLEALWEAFKRSSDNLGIK